MLSNFYPPNHIGGYELGCSKIVQLLRSRGHDCHVLSSDYGDDISEAEEGVHRILEHSFYETDEPRRLGRIHSLILDVKNRRKVKKLIQQLQPEIVFIFNPMWLTPGTLVQASSSKAPTCCLVSDEWMCNWKTSGNHHYSRLHSLKNGWFLEKIIHLFLKFLGVSEEIDLPQFNETIFVSKYLQSKARECGVAIENSSVVHWGIDRDKFLCKRVWGNSSQKILYCGQISPHKGTVTIIHALSIVQKRSPNQKVELTISGPCVHLEFQEELYQLTADLGLTELVDFRGPTAHEEIPALMQRHDIFVFPSVWQEPFSIVLVEAMASGLAVVSTDTGGTKEILKDGINGVRFDPNNSKDCAEGILRLLQDRKLCTQLSQHAIESTAGLTIGQMVDKLEYLLLRATVNNCALDVGCNP